MKELPGSILIIVENLPVPFDRRVWMESLTLREAGYNVIVICPKGKGFEEKYEEKNGIHIYRHNLPEEISNSIGYIREYLFALWHEWRLAVKIRKRHRFNVIHGCNPPDLIFIVALYFKLFYRTKFIFDQHDLNPELYESKFKKRGLFYSLLKIAERLTYKTADLVIATNESYKENALNRGRKKEGDVFVVRSGPDLSIFTPMPVERKYFNSKKYLVGYLGVMGEFDGVDGLIECVNYIVNEKKRTDIQFCLIGSGPCFDDLNSMSENLDLTDYIELTGRLSDHELISRLSSCDVCVNPDPPNPLNEKSTMNKILEYMALSKPIVQYNLLEGRRSALEASLYARPGDIKDFADKIIYLLENPNKRKEMGEFGRNRMVEKLEWNYQKKILLTAYEHVFK